MLRSLFRIGRSHGWKCPPANYGDLVVPRGGIRLKPTTRGFGRPFPGFPSPDGRGAKSMKNLSRSLTRSRRSQAFMVLSADSTDSPSELYAKPQCRRAPSRIRDRFRRRAAKKGLPRPGRKTLLALRPMLYAFKASIERVVNSGRVACFSTVAGDSPARVLNRRAIWLSASRTSSCRAAWICC